VKLISMLQISNQQITGKSTVITFFHVFKRGLSQVRDCATDSAAF